MAREQTAGVILAGGRGSRIGGAKALVSLAGQPLIAHVARALSGADVLAVVGDEQAANAVGAAFLSDFPGAAQGPLAGMMSGLAWAAEKGASWLCCAPCDVPLLPEDLVARLRGGVSESGLVCAETDAGLEPLISFWGVELAGRVRDAIADGAHPAMHDLVRDLGAVRVRLEAEQVMNINTREDLARAEALFARRAPKS